MATAMRSAARLLREAVGARMTPQQHQQRRSMAHDLYVKNNKFVEQWLSRREDIDREFTLSTRDLSIALVFALGIPIGVYNLIVSGMHDADDYADRPRRDFLWAHASTPAKEQ